ncbi:synaptobrevin, longin-like domain protein [Tanacetum coccineum]
MIAYLHKLEESKGFHQIIDFLTASHIKYALTENPTIYVSLKQFWQTATASTLEDGDMGITATIDGKVKVVFEASIRRHLKLEDSDGISTLSTAEIFKQLALMGYVSNSDSLTFQKGHFSPQWKFLIHTILHCLSSEKTAWEQFSSNIATAIICLATNRTFNFSKLIFKAMVKNLDTSSPSMPTIHVAETAAPMPYDSPLLRVHSLGSDECSLTLPELTVLCTSLSKKVESLESDLKLTKQTYGVAYTKLVMKVKKLEHQVKSIKARRKVRLVISDNEDDLEDPFKQGRKMAQIDEDEGITLVQMGAQTQGRSDEDLMYETGVYDYPEGFTGPSVKITTTEPVTTALEGVSTARAIPEEVSTAKPDMDVTLAEALMDLLKSGKKKSPKFQQKDKGKAIMTEPEKPSKKKDQIQIDEELALRLHAEEQAKFERLQKERATQEEASRATIYEEIDNIQAMIEADEKLAARVQAKEQELYFIEEKSRLLVEMIEERKRFFSAERAAEQRSKPPTKSQMRNRMCTYLRNMESDDKDKNSEKKAGGCRKKTLARKRAGDDVAIIRANGSTKSYKIFTEMLDDFDRQDVLDLYRLVKERLFDSCGVHVLLMNTGIAIHMLVEKTYPLTQEMLSRMLSGKLEVDNESEMAFELLRFIRSQIENLGEDCWELRASIKFILLVQLSTAKLKKFCTAQIITTNTYWTAKLRNDIMMFQQHHGESLSEAWTRFKDLIQKVPHHGIDHWHQIQIFYDHVSFYLKCEIDRAGSKLRDKNADESWEIIENLAFYDHEGWNDAKEFVKLVKAISTPHSTSKTPDQRVLELEDHINFLIKGSRLTPRPSSTHIPQAHAEAVYSIPRL